MALVDDLRELVGADSSEYQRAGLTYWSDVQLQEALDRHRSLTWREKVVYSPEIGAGGSAVYRRGMVGGGYYEPGTAAGTLVTSQGSAAPGWTIDRQGWLTFAADQKGTAYYWSAWAYDLYSAAADVLDRWASHLKLDYDFSSDDQSFSRSQRIESLREQAVTYRRRKVGRMTAIAPVY